MNPVSPYTRQRAETLIRKLIQLEEDSNSEQSGASRAALAHLRQSIQNPLRAAKYVAPLLPPSRDSTKQSSTEEEWELECFYLVAALFAHHQQHEAKDSSLGDAFRHIREDSDSVEQRFLHLLTCRTDQLTAPLRHAVDLLSAHGIALNWYRLIDDLLRWDADRKPVQHALARDFYRTDNPAADGTPAPAPDTAATPDN